VLCLAAGGGQQSVAFALLGAHVTVFDLSDTQLERDRLAAEHFGVRMEYVQGDMRHLDMFDDNVFDVVYQPFSINFVPDVRPVHRQVARVLRPGGVYRLEWSNPFTQTVDEASWTGEGYLLSHPYEDGREVTEIFPDWDVTDPDGNLHRIPGPHEFVHTLSTMVNSLVDHGFVIIRASEDRGNAPAGEPGSWPHFMRFAVPYLTLWSRYLPGTVQPSGDEPIEEPGE
jgi:SAM-dependent methyltransferase